MKAWRIHAFGDMQLDDVPMPEVKPGWVLVKVRMVQPSITEVQASRGVALSATANLRKLVEECAPIQLFGHEFCGEVVEVADGACEPKVGDRVIYWRRPACHTCALCRGGYEDLCRSGPLLGIDIPGCLAEYVVLPEESVIGVPDSMTDSEATAMQPFAVAVAEVNSVRIDLGDTVVVLGQGVMGLNILQLSRVCGSGKTIVVDVRNAVLTLSRRFGADLVINANSTDPVEAILEATEGRGADIVFDCAGGSPSGGLSGTATLRQAARMVRDQGKIMGVSVLEPGASVEVGPANLRGVAYVGHGACTRKLIRYAIDLVASRRVQLAPTVTHILEGIDKVAQAFEITGDKAKYGAVNPPQVLVAH